jgi:hypothetical protein
MSFYRNYIKNGNYYPEKEIRETQGLMMGHIDLSSIRDYIYNIHYRVVVERIETELSQSFDQIPREKNIALLPALRCPVNLYHVISINESSVVGRNLFFSFTQRLFLLEGLEKPRVGDIVSGHWNYFLETVNGWEDLEKCKCISQSHLKKLFQKL